MEVSGKAILITGASSGIGAATARLFGTKGARVAVTCRKNVEGARQVVTEIEQAGGKAISIQADVRREADVERMVSTVNDTFGAVDVLINNAGGVAPGAFNETTLNDWKNAFDVNFFGAVLCAQHASRIMLAQKSGKIINTSSVRGVLETGAPDLMAYSAAKAAINSFTKTLAKELSPFVNVNAVAPGIVYTENYKGLPQSLTDRFINASALRRWITADEVARAFLYLAEADAVTGAILMVDAGFTLKDC